MADEPKNEPPFLNDRMKALREEQGLTQAECGEASGLGQARWADLEAGRYSNLSLSTFIAIARALDVEGYEVLLPPLKVEKAAQRKPKRKAGG